ncbi:nuclear transport factor 2 family protein [Thalassospira sp. A40-3]|uniref:nuclear transport factor 2 family protein n=1 Tax=Thalassospira sp. A40-3 TaxID=2785908 RepID=UPI0018CEE3E0|nr:nuclear transport factor 2 family protein [Thalassospira sp. A40-3]QPO10304.1 nuclear transport factor 2 family protein [Thalassospira sp. A40-3]
MPNSDTARVILPVRSQLEAYNAKDIDAFLKWWAPDCEYYSFPSTLLARGQDEIRLRHEERFREPDLHGHLHSRSVVGNLVVDYETVTRNFPEGKGEVDVIGLYEVEDALIVRAWFKMGQMRLV